MRYNEIANCQLNQGDPRHEKLYPSLRQLTALFPRHDFEYLAKIPHNGQKLRSYNRWSQFLAMTIAQLSGLKSLRDIQDSLMSQGKRI